MSLYALLEGHLLAGANSAPAEEILQERRWQGVLVTFGLLLVVMYLKGLVRVALVQMYLAIIPSIILVAVLYDHRSAFSLPVRILNGCLFWLSLIAASWSGLHEIRFLQLKHSSVAERILPFKKDASLDTQADWCETEIRLPTVFASYRKTTVFMPLNSSLPIPNRASRFM